MADGTVRLKVQVEGNYVLTYDKKRLKAIMRRAGAEVAALARSLIRRSEGGGKTYRGPGGSAAKYRGGYKPGRYTASQPGQAPTSVTGSLLGAIKARPFKSGEGVAIRDNMFYALFLEKGAKGGSRKKSGGKRVRGEAGTSTPRVLAPRPFLTVALEKREQSIAQRIKASIIDDIEFRRVRP